MLFSNRNEFLHDSSRIEPIYPNIRNDIVSESGMTRSSSRLVKKKLMKPHECPRIRKKSIRGDSGDSWPVWNRGIRVFIIKLKICDLDLKVTPLYWDSTKNVLVLYIYAS